MLIVMVNSESDVDVDGDGDGDSDEDEDVFYNLPFNLSPLHIWPSSSSTSLRLSCLLLLLTIINIIIIPGNTLLLRVYEVKVVVVHAGQCQIWSEDTK